MSRRFRSALALLAATQCGLLLACDEPAPTVETGPRPVKMLTLGADGEGRTREYPGRIKAGQYSEMGFEVPGKVVDFVFKEGAPVKKGAVLAKLDPRDYQARYDSAAAKLEHSRAERARYKEMYDKDVKPYSEYELRMRVFEVDQAALREARKALDDTKLDAPFDGVMARKLVEKFESVQAKQPVLVMQNDDLLEIKISVPERDLATGGGAELSPDELTKRLSPRVVVSSLPGREFPAVLTEVASVADPTTRTFEATFRFVNPDGVNILGGMTAKIVIDQIQREGASGLQIPSNAVLPGEGGRSKVWVVDTEDFTVHARSVLLGPLLRDMVVVEEGLEAGETIAISGVHQLRDGMVVRRFER